METKEEYLPSLGLCYIATHLKEAGITAEIVDCAKDRLGIKDIFALLMNRQPHYLGVNIFTQNLETVREIAENCPTKSHLVVGGQVTKAIYEEILTWSVSNRLIVIIGEGELIFPDIVNGICTQPPLFQNETKIIYQVDNTSPYFPSDLGKVHMDRNFLKDEVLTNHYGEEEVAIITSRGCTYDCAFCGAARSKNSDTTIRLRSNKDVMTEITEITSLHPTVSSIRVLDDLFLRDEESVYIAAELFKGFSSLHWRGMAHIMTFLHSAKLLPLLQQSGCRELFIGVESGSDIVRKQISKSGTSQQAVNVITDILNAGIDVKAYLMFGFPGESKEDAFSTYGLAKSLASVSSKTLGKFRTSVFQFRPYHGTKLYDKLTDSGVKIGITKRNKVLNVFEKRSQFNFTSGNYSNMSDNDLNDFILNTQRLTGGN
jgi:radical SAM superfamily enzyme YgiQ (UPF0313 family)